MPGIPVFSTKSSKESKRPKNGKGESIAITAGCAGCLLSPAAGSFTDLHTPESAVDYVTYILQNRASKQVDYCVAFQWCESVVVLLQSPSHRSALVKFGTGTQWNKTEVVLHKLPPTDGRTEVPDNSAAFEPLDIMKLPWVGFLLVRKRGKNTITHSEMLKSLQGLWKFCLGGDDETAMEMAVLPLGDSFLFMMPVAIKDKQETLMKHIQEAPAPVIVKHCEFQLMTYEDVTCPCATSTSRSLPRAEDSARRPDPHPASYRPDWHSDDFWVSLLDHTDTEVDWQRHVMSDLEQFYRAAHGRGTEAEAGFVDGMVEALENGWQSQHWKQQFENSSNEKPRSKRRALLRTVGMATLLAVWKGKYLDDNGSEVDIQCKPEESIFFASHACLGSWVSAVVPQDWPPIQGNVVVQVKKDDCLLVAKRLSTNVGTRALVLNMAKADSPGGDWRTGADAQEEDLYRRSNYFVSTDTELRDAAPERNKYHRDCPLPEPAGACLTIGVTVFRGRKEDGYPFLPQAEQHKVDMIAVAGHYFDQRQEQLPDEVLLELKVKIDLIFRVAIHKGHTLLVLSALSCGAFNCPAEDVAEIFRTSIDQYGNYFSHIIFAVTGSNFHPFARILNDYRPQTCKMRCDMPDNRSTRKKLCRYGGLCHTAGCDYLHPPLCADDNCGSSISGMPDSRMAHIHTVVWRHLPKCREGAECQKMGPPGDATDEQHAAMYQHPPECPDGHNCQDSRPEHLAKFRHVKLCSIPDCVGDCGKRLRHWRNDCPHGESCRRIFDPLHMALQRHPDARPVCSHGLSCNETEESHFRDFAHPCPMGEGCERKATREGCKYAFHPRYPQCRDGATCRKHTNLEEWDEEHAMSYQHPGQPFIRKFCMFGDGCKQTRDLRHRQEFVHRKPSLPPCPIRDLINQVKDPDNPNLTYDFTQAHAQLKLKVEERVELQSRDNFSKIVEWVTRLRPMHQVKPAIFQSMLRNGCFLSIDSLQTIWSCRESSIDSEACKKAFRIVRDVATYHPDVQAVFKELEGKIVAAATFKEVRAWVGNEAVTVFSKRVKETFGDSGISVYSTEKLTGSAGDEGDALAAVHSKLEKFRGMYDKLQRLAADVADGCFKIVEKQKEDLGIGCAVDMHVGTYRHVFSIIGPHTGVYGTIVLVLKRDIMHHPDFNFTVNAATSINGLTPPVSAKLRPWCGAVENAEPLGSACKDGHKSCCFRPKNLKPVLRARMNPMVKDWAELAALELVGQVAETLTKEPSAVTLEDLKKYWETANSHSVLEGHLPGLVSLQYVHSIIIPKSEKLAEEDTKRLETLKTKFGIEIIYDDKPTGRGPDSFKRLEPHCQAPLENIIGISVTLPAMNAMAPQVLPLYLKDSQKYFIFKASAASTFFVSFAKGDFSKGSTTVMVGRKQSQSYCAVRDGNPLNPEEFLGEAAPDGNVCYNFDEGLPNDASALNTYMIIIDQPKAGQERILITHALASAVLNPHALVVTLSKDTTSSTSGGYRIGLSTSLGIVSFTDVITRFNISPHFYGGKDQEHILYEQAAVQKDMKRKHQLHTDSEKLQRFCSEKHAYMKVTKTMSRSAFESPSWKADEGASGVPARKPQHKPAPGPKHRKKDHLTSDAESSSCSEPPPPCCGCCLPVGAESNPRAAAPRGEPAASGGSSSPRLSSAGRGTTAAHQPRAPDNEDQPTVYQHAPQQVSMQEVLPQKEPQPGPPKPLSSEMRLCRHGMECRGLANGSCKFRHEKKMCRYGNACDKKADLEHCRKFKH